MKILLKSKNVAPLVLGTVRHFVVNLCCAEANSSKLILTNFHCRHSIQPGAAAAPAAHFSDVLCNAILHLTGRLYLINAFLSSLHSTEQQTMCVVHTFSRSLARARVVFTVTDPDNPKAHFQTRYKPQQIQLLNAEIMVII